MIMLVQERTLHTYFASVVDGKRAVKYLRARNLLSTYRTIMRGHHKFILHMPPTMAEAAGRRVIAEAFADVHIEPAVYAEVPAPAAGTFPDRQAFGRALRPVASPMTQIGELLATLSLFREPDGTVEITVAHHTQLLMAEYHAADKGCGWRPIDLTEDLIIEAAERIKARRK